MNIADNIAHYVILVVVATLTGSLMVFERIRKIGLFGSKEDVMQEAFYGGSSVLTHNLATVALACSCACSPSLIVEGIYLNTGDAISLVVARTVSLLLCTVIWKRIASLGLHSISAYLFYRFDSNVAVLFYYANATLSFVYILFIYNGPLLFSLLEYFKLNQDGFFIFVGLLVPCCFGGIRVALPLCSMLSILELAGNALLLVRANSKESPNNYTNATAEKYFCHSRNPLHVFAATFPILLTSQPLYTLFYSVKSQRAALAAMSVGHAVFVIKTIIALMAASSMKGFSRASGIPHHRMFHALFSSKSVTNFTAIPGGNGSMEYVKDITELGFSGAFALNAAIYGSMAAYYALRTSIFVAELNEKYIPDLIRKTSFLTGLDLQRIHCSFHVCLTSVVVFSLLSADEHILMPHFHTVTLYVPHWTTALMSGVTTMLTVAVLTPRLRLLPFISSWCLTQFFFVTPRSLLIWKTHQDSIFGAMSDWWMPEYDGWTCFGVWFNFITLVANGLMLAAFPLALGGSGLFPKANFKVFSKAGGATSFLKTVDRATIALRRGEGVATVEESTTMMSTEVRTFTSSISDGNGMSMKRSEFI